MPPKHQKTQHEIDADKEKLKQAALLWWAQCIYQLAHEACLKQGAYKNDFMYWTTIVSVLQQATNRLNQLGNNRPVKTSQHLDDQATWKSSTTNCDSDADCPDDYICVEGNCEYLFPMD